MGTETTTTDKKCDHCKKRPRHEDYRYCKGCLPGKRDRVRAWIRENEPKLKSLWQRKPQSAGSGRHSGDPPVYPVKWRVFSVGAGAGRRMMEQ